MATTAGEADEAGGEEMKRLIFAILFYTGAAFGQSGQGANTIFQRVFLNQTTAAVSPAVRTTGQEYHRLDVYANNFCVNGGSIFIEASNNGVNYIPLSVPLTSLDALINPASSAVNFHGSTSATGSFAYVRANYNVVFSSSGGTCAITVYYAGAPNGTLAGSAPYTTYNDSGFQYFNNKTSSMLGPGAIICGGTTMGLQIYSVSLSAPGGANTVTLAMNQNNAGGSFVANYWTYNIGLTATNPNWVQPQGSRPYLVVPASQVGVYRYGLMLTQSAATEVDYAISYRCE